MKIVLSVGTDIAILEKSGEPYFRQVAYSKLIKQKGFHYFIIVLTKDKKLKPINTLDLEVIPINNNIYNRYIGIFFTIWKLNLKSKIVAITCQSPSDYAWPVLLFSRLFKIPFVGQIHFDIFSPFAIDDAFGSTIIGRIRYFITIRSLKFHSYIRVVGKRIAENIVKKKILSKERLKIIPVMVPMLDNVTQLKVEKSNRSVLFVGRLVEPKNLKLWLDVAKFILKNEPNITFDIVGDGHLRNSLQGYAKNLGIDGSITFHGFKKYDELLLFYKKSSVFLLTSNYEGFGRVVVEAYSNRVPVVSTNITGVEDIIIDNVTGYLVDFDVRSVGIRVLELINDTQKAMQFGNAGFQFVKVQFNPEKLKEEWIEFLLSGTPKLLNRLNKVGS